jgi:hypothetical protein
MRSAWLGQAVKCSAAMHDLVIFDRDGVLVDSEVISGLADRT